MPLTVTELAGICDGVVEGDPDRLITGADTLERAGPSDLAFAAGAKALHAAAQSNAGCMLLPPGLEIPGKRSIIRVQNSRMAFARALAALYPPKQFQEFVHPTALLAATVHVGAGSFIGAYTVIGSNSEIGAGSFIGSGCIIGDGVRIGSKSIVHANVCIYDHVRIGARAILHSGCVIGADGFGFTRAGDHYDKFPQVGIVEIGDDVEIGANCCIDRAALGVTRIGDGTKLDNLVHIAHNCIVGKHVVIAAQTGLSGSVSIGDYAVVGGQVGIGEKAVIEAHAVIGGKAGILTSQSVGSGEPVWGIPARPLRGHLKNLAYTNRLPEMKKDLDELKKRLAALEASQQVAKA